MRLISSVALTSSNVIGVVDAKRACRTPTNTRRHTDRQKTFRPIFYSREVTEQSPVFFQIRCFIVGIELFLRTPALTEHPVFTSACRAMEAPGSGVRSRESGRNVGRHTGDDRFDFIEEIIICERRPTTGFGAPLLPGLDVGPSDTDRLAHSRHRDLPFGMTTNATDIFWACRDFKHLFEISPFVVSFLT